MNQQAEGPARVEVLRAGSDTFARVEELVQAYRREDPFGRITVVVPSYYSAYYLRRRLAPRGYFNVDLTRLDDLAEKIGGSHVERPPLTRLQASALVYSAAMSAPAESRIGPIRSHTSLHTALRSTFRQLEALGQDPVPLLPEGSKLVREVADIYLAYRRSRAGWREQVDVARAAAGALQKGEYPAAGLGKLIVLRIEVPPPQFAPLDRALARIPGASILVASSGDEDADRLVGANVAGNAPSRSSEIAGREKSKVKLISSPDRASEVRYVVREVVRHAVERSIPFYRMAVLFDDHSYGYRVEEALKFAGVPVSGPDPVPDSASPEGRFITGLLDLFLAHQEGGWTRQDFARWVTSAPVSYPGTGREVPAARWDAISRSASVTAGIGGFRARLGRYARRQRAYADNITDSDDLHEIRASSYRSQAEHAEKMLEFAEGLADRAPSAGSSDLPAHSRWLRGLWDSYLLRSGTPDPVIERVERLFDEMEELKSPAGEKMALQHFSALVREELDRQRRNLRHPGQGVFVAPLSMTAGCEFDVVHILGMSEGSYPGRDRDDPLLPDAVKSELDPAGVVMPDRLRRARLERRTFLVARGTASTQYLYWPRGEAGARRGSGPARWFLEAARDVSSDQSLQPNHLLLDSPENPVVILPDETPANEAISVPADRHEYTLKSADAWRSADRPRGDHFLASDPAYPVRRALDFEDARQTSEWTVFDGNLSSADPGERKLPIVSASRFESWANCPYRYFLAYVAGVGPTERPEDEPGITPLERGSIVHHVLEHFVKERSAREIDDRAGQLELLRELVGKSFDEFEGDGSSVHPALLAMERESIVRNLERWLSAESEIMAEWGVEPIEPEFEFGFGGSTAPAVEVPIGNGETVLFRGKIDRIDKSDDGNRIIVADYKTGVSRTYRDLEEDPVIRGTALQLPLYTRAALAMSEGEAIDPVVQAAYWFVFEKGGTVLKPDLANQPVWVEKFDEVVSVIAGGIRDGVFPPAPRGRPGRRDGKSELENCRWCPYDAVCPADRMDAWNLKRDAPGVKAYRELSE